jgi:hypothetical protein
VSLVLERAGDAGRTLPVLHASERAGGLPTPEGPAPVLQYELRLPSGAPLRAALYLVYASPLSDDGAVQRPLPEAQQPGAAPAAATAASHAWLGVSRAHCCRGCDADVPLMAGIQRLARPTRSAAASTPTARPRAATGAASAASAAAAAAAAVVTASAAEEACEEGGVSSSRVKDAKHIYVSLDEPSAHVAPGPGGTRRFRLLLAVWGAAAEGDAVGAHSGPLLGAALSRPIRVVANNDVPGGAAALTLRVPLSGATRLASVHAWRACARRRRLTRLACSSRACSLAPHS